MPSGAGHGAGAGTHRCIPGRNGKVCGGTGVVFRYCVCWVSGFDIIYALQDEDFDRAQGLHSIPEALGGARALAVSRLLHFISAALVVAAGLMGPFSLIYWAAAAVFMGLLVYQHRLVSPTDLSRVDLAFGTTNGRASVLFAIGVIAALYIPLSL